MTVLQFAWRNIWRNKRRTAITLAAVGFTAAILIVSYTLMEGLMIHSVSNATNLVMGETQIHVKKYLVNRSLYKSIPDPEGILSTLKKKNIPGTARSYGYGLVASGTKSAGATFWGVDPDAESRVFELARHVGQGEFLPSKAKKGIVLGRKLARSLNASIGTEIVVVVQAADGSLGNELFYVAGILKAAGDMVDRNAAIIHKDDYEELFVSEGRIHEIALNTKSKMELSLLAGEAEAAAPDLDVKTWRQLAPTLSDMMNIFDVAIWIFGFIFFLAGGLGVMNTMLMATFERIREFGILKAIGTTPWRIVRDVTAEALVLTLAAIVIGSLVGLAGAWYLQVVGLDTTMFGSADYTISGIAFDPVWKAIISVKAVLAPGAVLLVICLLASIYPAIIAARLDPVKAISHV